MRRHAALSLFLLLALSAAPAALAAVIGAPRIPHARTAPTARPFYGGGRHTQSHGGRYTSPAGSHLYGRHK